MLQLFRDKVYLLDIEAMTLVLKVVQALDRYFLVEAFPVFKDGASSLT